MIEKNLINQCSPTLASLKTASLFTVNSDLNTVIEDIKYWNKVFLNKNLTLKLLRYKNGVALIYLYRSKKLEQDFNKRGVKRFLKNNGYESADVNSAINTLRKKLNNSDSFPHEIGLFLGYPLGDVIGFIKNSGKNSKCCGCWKVYCNECEAIKTFNRFKKCKNIYSRLWSEGNRSISQLTVA
ncbi:MAG: DUF3793 family protein [Ruminococcus sp.]|jgi:hypothetical protein|nr:DUF3793 family protein [Ruminococcus sp.]